MEIVLDRLGATFPRGHYSLKKWMNYLTKINTGCLFSVKRVDRTVTCIVNDSHNKSMLIFIRGQNITLWRTRSVATRWWVRKEQEKLIIIIFEHE